MGTLTDVARRHGFAGASFTAIGACERVTLAYFDWQTKQYQHHDIDEQVELASLVGNVATSADGQPKIHMHGIVATASLEARAGQ